MRQGEKLYLIGIPRGRKTVLVERAVDAGIAVAMDTLLARDRVTVRVWLLPQNDALVRGLSSRAKAAKKSIHIFITPKFFRQKGAASALAGTVAHEYVHHTRLVSGRHDAKTVLDWCIEEGIALYIAAALFRPQPDLDIKTLHEKMVRVCWDKFSRIVDKPARIGKYRKLGSDQVYRTILYRLGFGIVRRFMESSRGISLPELIRMPTKKLNAFAKKVYGGKIVRHRKHL